ncbi:hypothetical protein PEBR_39726 [Penicillium brasilianum]|uniref:Short-chain dehydrogenase n=1 Tax=Penicillium brasilianum TaxID=104259 RepID=A0A1S9RA41_PENBI|nr:hypothetical protein PEBR_39726 [Penicillium brasilianum]
MSRYSAAYTNPRGINDARPTAMQMIHDEQVEDKLVGKAVVITGVSFGLGVETARALAATDASLYLTARDLDRAKNALGPSDNYHYQKGGYDPGAAYCQSKLANVYMANEIERRYGSQGLHATSLNPGIVATSLMRHMSEAELEALLQNPVVQKYQKSPEQGAATTVWGAVSQELEGKGGLFLDNCAVAARGDYDKNPFERECGAPYLLP